MARNYNPHEVHPITYMFVGFLLFLTLVSFAPLFNDSSRDLRSSAQIAGAHPTRTRTPTPRPQMCGSIPLGSCCSTGFRCRIPEGQTVASCTGTACAYRSPTPFTCLISGRSCTSSSRCCWGPCSSGGVCPAQPTRTKTPTPLPTFVKPTSNSTPFPCPTYIQLGSCCPGGRGTCQYSNGRRICGGRCQTVPTPLSCPVTCTSNTNCQGCGSGAFCRNSVCINPSPTPRLGCAEANCTVTQTLRMYCDGSSVCGRRTHKKTCENPNSNCPEYEYSEPASCSPAEDAEFLGIDCFDDGKVCSLTAQDCPFGFRCVDNGGRRVCSINL